MRSTATPGPAVVTSAGDDTASRTMSVLSSVREHAHIPTNVCGVMSVEYQYQSQMSQVKIKCIYARQQFNSIYLFQS